MHGKRHRGDPDKYRRNQSRNDRARIFKAFREASHAKPKANGIRIYKRDEKPFRIVFGKICLHALRLRSYGFVGVFKDDVRDVGKVAKAKSADDFFYYLALQIPQHAKRQKQQIRYIRTHRAKPYGKSRPKRVYRRAHYHHVYGPYRYRCAKT